MVIALIKGSHLKLSKLDIEIKLWRLTIPKVSYLMGNPVPKYDPVNHYIYRCIITKSCKSLYIFSVTVFISSKMHWCCICSVQCASISFSINRLLLGWKTNKMQTKTYIYKMWRDLTFFLFKIFFIISLQIGFYKLKQNIYCFDCHGKSYNIHYLNIKTISLKYDRPG